jgi:hypothetical protein
MSDEQEETIEETLRIMAFIIREQAVKLDIAPEFLEEVADEIAELNRKLAEKS